LKNKPKRLRYAAGALAIAISWIASISYAQNRPIERAERQRAEVLANEALSGTATVREEEEALGDDTPLGVSIAGLRLISDQGMATMSPEVQEVIEIDPTLPAPEGLAELLLPYIGEPLSMALLNRLGKDIVTTWRESDYPLVDVYFPEQNITQGKVQIVVREAVLGEKRQEGAVHSRPDYIVSNLRIDSGDRVNRRVVQADLDWLNENPIRQVNVIYEPGTEDGTSDILINVTEEKQLTAYASFANTGVNFTGQNEISFGVNLGNPWQTEQALGYQYTADVDFDSLSAHTVFYQKFLPWRHSLGIIGSYVTSEARTLLPFGVTGESSQLTGEYRIPLKRPEWNRNWAHAFTAAFDYKSTDTDLIFGGTNVFANDYAIGQFRFEYAAEFPDRFGFTRFSTGMIVSPGNMYGNNDDASFTVARPGATANYFYSYFDIEKLISLPQDWSLSIDIRAQATPDRLVSTEQLLAGGYVTVRGFDESIARADSGAIFNTELITPPFSLIDGVDDEWNAFLFYDAAALQYTDSTFVEAGPSLQSVGLGLNCRIGDLGFARAAYGWVVEDHGVDYANPGPGKFHFGMTVMY